jgi:hypothetical protein
MIYDKCKIKTDGERTTNNAKGKTMNDYEFWTDGGDEDDIEAESLDEAAEIASRKIGRAAWRDGAWGIVRDAETGEQMDVPRPWNLD